MAVGTARPPTADRAEDGADHAPPGAVDRGVRVEQRDALKESPPVMEIMAGIGGGGSKGRKR
jgi:hypothetical protein